MKPTPTPPPPLPRPVSPAPVVDDLRPSDLAAISWARPPAHVAAVAAALARRDRGGVAYLVLRDGADPVAVGGVDFAVDDAGCLWQLTVRPDRRSRGLGTVLVAGLEDATRARRRPFARLAVETDNPRAAALYARLGYRAVGTATDSWEAEVPDGTVVTHHAELVVMARRL